MGVPGSAQHRRKPHHAAHCALLLSALLIASCQSADAKRCRAEYLTTHALIESVDVDDFASVEKGLAAVESTSKACTAAGLHQELEQLDKVRNKLQSNFDYLRTHGKPRQLSPTELTALLKDGDPSCPKGQGYKPKNSEEQVRCTGPKLADMNLAQAKAYYENRGFKLTQTANQLKAEYGSESYTFEFDTGADTKPARCIRVFAAPGIPWEESLSRLTGVSPQRLVEGKPVKTSRGELTLAHTKDATQAIYRLGKCD